MKFPCTAGCTGLVCALFEEGMCIVLVIVLALKCDTENFQSKDKNMRSFLEHGQTVIAASGLRIRSLT